MRGDLDHIILRARNTAQKQITSYGYADFISGLNGIRRLCSGSASTLEFLVTDTLSMKFQRAYDAKFGSCLQEVFTELLNIHGDVVWPWRGKKGEGPDIVFERGTRLFICEVKSSFNTFNSDGRKGCGDKYKVLREQYQEKYPEKRVEIVLLMATGTRRAKIPGMGVQSVMQPDRVCHPESVWNIELYGEQVWEFLTGDPSAMTTMHRNLQRQFATTQGSTPITLATQAALILEEIRKRHPDKSDNQILLALYAENSLPGPLTQDEREYMGLGANVPKVISVAPPEDESAFAWCT
jgi:hypothetical protein